MVKSATRVPCLHNQPQYYVRKWVQSMHSDRKTRPSGSTIKEGEDLDRLFSSSSPSAALVKPRIVDAHQKLLHLYRQHGICTYEPQKWVRRTYKRATVETSVDIVARDNSNNLVVVENKYGYENEYGRGIKQMMRLPSCIEFSNRKACPGSTHIATTCKGLADTMENRHALQAALGALLNDPPIHHAYVAIVNNREFKNGHMFPVSALVFNVAEKLLQHLDE